MARLYRVVTVNINGKYSVMTPWQSWAKCRQAIIGRWQHFPPFAFISSARTDAGLRRVTGAWA
jgi:hypothetical protein